MRGGTEFALQLEFVVFKHVVGALLGCVGCRGWGHVCSSMLEIALRTATGVTADYFHFARLQQSQSEYTICLWIGLLFGWNIQNIDKNVWCCKRQNRYLKCQGRDNENQVIWDISQEWFNDIIGLVIISGLLKLLILIKTIRNLKDKILKATLI